MIKTLMDQQKNSRCGIVGFPASIGQALLDYATEHECKLIITGDRCGTIVERIVLGSTSRYVLREAPCSVLIARFDPPRQMLSPCRP